MLRAIGDEKDEVEVAGRMAEGGEQAGGSSLILGQALLRPWFGSLCSQLLQLSIVKLIMGAKSRLPWRAG